MNLGYTLVVPDKKNSLTVIVEGLISNPIPDGLTRYSLALSEHLKEFDINLCFMFPKDVIFSIPEGATKKVWLPPKPLHLRNWYRFLYLQGVFPRHLECFEKFSKPDIIFHTGPEASLFTDIPQIMVIHDINPLLFPQYHPRLHFYYRHVLPKILRKVTTVITVSEATRNDIETIYRNRLPSVRVVHNGVNHDLFSQDGEIIESKKERILYVGALRPIKGLEVLLLAFAHIDGQFPLELWIVGKGNEKYAAGLKRFAKDLGIGEKVKWIGTPSDEKLAAIYRGSSLFILPSFYEGFGLPALEAMATGVPIVVSDIPALREITGGKAQYFPQGDWLYLAKTIVRVLSSKELREKMRDEGIRYSFNYSWEYAAREIYKVFLDIKRTKISG